MTDSQALEKIKVQLIEMVETANKEIKIAKSNKYYNKVSFWAGGKCAMETTLEMIYKDTIEL